MCREDMAQHVEQNCPEKEVECPFAKYKCEVTSIKRKHLEAHLENNRTEHMELKQNHLEDSMTQNTMNWQKSRKDIESQPTDSQNRSTHSARSIILPRR